MIAVIFEVWPAERRTQEYLDLAAALRDDLATIDGFLSVERFRSLSEPDKLLSLSFWQDEAAVRAWRRRPDHRATQAKGRAGIFRDYRLRIAGVMRDYGLNDRDQAPPDSQAAHSQAAHSQAAHAVRPPPQQSMRSAPSGHGFVEVEPRVIPLE